MVHHKIEFDEECKSCKGTGVYVGFAEARGTGVLCLTCKGTGKHHFVYEYEEFVRRKVREGIVRIMQVNPGIRAAGGMSYKDFLDGKVFGPGSEDRGVTCPAWWYQAADSSKKPEWEWCMCNAFRECSHFATKDACWKRWDSEFGNAD